MKIIQFFTKLKSRQTKSSLAIIIVAAVLVELTSALQYWYAYKGIKEETKNSAQKELNVKSLEISRVMTGVEEATNNFAWMLEQHLQNPDTIKGLSEYFLNHTQNVVGCGLAFSENFYPDKGKWFEPYTKKYPNGQIKHDQIGKESHDYLQMEFYQKTINNNEGIWTEPYFDNEGAKMLLCTYTQPIHDKNGNIVGVLGADVSLDWLSNLINDSTSIQQSVNILLSDKGTIIACPVESLEMRKDIMEVTENLKDEGVAELNNNMLKGNRGEATIEDENGDKQYVFYAPVHGKAGWSMAVTYADKDIFRNLRRIGLISFIIMVTGMVLLFFIVTRTIRGFNKLQAVSAEKAAISNELKIASGIQMAMIPKIFPPYPERDDLDVFAQITSAKEVGGDLFDFYIRDEKLFFCIGDVSGKGVPASLVMAVVKTQFRTASAHESRPDKIIMAINNTMSEGNDSCMFVTFFVGVLDLPTGRLRYCNAGHNAPLLVGKNIGILPCDSNLPLGTMAGWKFVAQETLVDTDTYIFLYTDGLTEAENLQKDQFGEQRMIETLRTKTDNPEQLVNAITQAVQQFVGDAEQSDDITLLAVQYKKHHGNVKMQRSIMVTNNLEDVPKVANFVENVCQEAHFNHETTMQINLAIEEAVVNVMNYAYPKGAKGMINLVAQTDETRLKFVISDKGKAFDPTAQKDIDTDMPLEDRQVGGLGIHLIRNIMDSINYERVDGVNILTLRKKLKPELMNQEGYDD